MEPRKRSRRRNCPNYYWRTCLFVLLALKQLESAATKTTTEEHETYNDKAIEAPHGDKAKQVEDSEQAKLKWKRWLRRLLLQEQLESFGLLDGLLPHAWRRKARSTRKMTASALMYLENDARRARTYLLEPSEEDMVGLMAPLHVEDQIQQGAFSGMILQVDYGPPGDNAFSGHHDRFQIPFCQDIEAAAATLNAIDTYQLLEPMHMELGLATKHAIDYVYKPVELGSQYYHQHYHPEYYSPTALVEETIRFDEAMNSHQHWWKWWFPFGRNTHTFWKDADEEYKLGESAFAGGSHGEVWRGQRLCREDRKRRMGMNPEEEVCKDNQPLIFKRLKVEHGYKLLEAGLREVYLGRLLAEDDAADGLFTKYVNHFFREIPKQSTNLESRANDENELELWIVFEDAGPSLRSYLYSPMSTGDFVVYQHSYFWTRLRRAAKTSKSKLKDGDLEDEEKSISMLFGEGELDINDSFGTTASGNATIDGKVLMKEVLRQILTAAAYLHEHGIVHR